MKKLCKAEKTHTSHFLSTCPPPDPLGTINSCTWACVCVWSERTPATDCGRADTGFWWPEGENGWKWPPDGCVNIITPDKNRCALIRTQYFRWTLKARLRLLPHSLIICDAAVPNGVTGEGGMWGGKVDEKQKRHIELKVLGRSIRLRGDELTHISEDVKGGQTPGCAAGNYWDTVWAEHGLTPHPGCCREAGGRGRALALTRGPVTVTLAQCLETSTTPVFTRVTFWCCDYSAEQKHIIPQVSITGFNYRNG